MTYKMNKSEAFKQIDAYLAGSLTEPERIQFEALVKSDETLDRAIHQAKRVDQLLSGQEWVSPSADFSKSVMLRIEAESLMNTEMAGEMPFEIQDEVLLERLLVSQSWLAPSVNFTHNVMQRIELATQVEPEIATVSRRESVIDWIQGLAPAAAVIAFVIMFGKSIFEGMLNYLHMSAAFIDAAIGTKVFESQPLIQLGVIVPLIGVALISAMVTRRLKLAS
jgi:hypothetical protein